MPRKPTEYSEIFPYHITNRSNNKDFFYLDMEKLWDLFCDELRILHTKYGCEIISFVLMSNHYHLLIQTPKANIGDAMRSLHREIARKANKQTGRINHFFGGRYKWSIIKQNIYFWNCYKYVYQNPVRANLVTSVEAYQYSTLKRPFSFLSREYFELSTNLKWLNQPYQNETAQAITKGLRRREFTVSRNRSGYLTEFDLPSR